MPSDPGPISSPFRLCSINIGNSKPMELLRHMQILEYVLGAWAKKIMHLMEPGTKRGWCAEDRDPEADSYRSSFFKRWVPRISWLPKFLGYYR